MASVKYDPQVFAKYEQTHYVFARIHLPSEDPDNVFDGQILTANDDQVTVSAVVAGEGLRNFTVPASCIHNMHVGAKR